MDKIEAVSPVGRAIGRQDSTAPRLDNLDGKTIGEAWNGVFKGDYTFPIIRTLLRERFPSIKIIPYTEFPYFHGADDPAKQKELAKQIAAIAKEKHCDAIISGNGA